MRGLLLVALVFAAPAAAQCTLSWVSPAGGAWTDAFNWNLNRLPTPADEVCITAPGTYTVTVGPVNVRRLTLGGANGTQTLVVDTFAGIDLALPSAVEPGGVLEWRDGILTGALTNRGTVRLVPTGAVGLRISGPASVLRNEATLDWVSGDLSLVTRARLENAGVLTLLGGGSVQPTNTGGPFVVANEAAGTIRKTGPGAFLVGGGVTLDNRGALDVRAGALVVDGTGTYTDTPLAVAAGATLHFRTEPQTFVGTLSGAPAGDVLLSAPWRTTAAGLTLALGGTGLQWQDSRLVGGRVMNTGRLRLPASGGERTVDGAGTVLRNAGTVEWSGSLRLVDRGRVENAALVTVDDPSFLRASNTAGPLAFVNEASATLRKTGSGDFTVESGVAFETGGVLDVQAGALVNDAATRFLDGSRFAVAAGATLHLRTNRQTFVGTTTGAPAGTLRVSAPVEASPRAVWAFSGTGVEWADGGLFGGRLVTRGTIRLVPPTTGLRVEGGTSVLRNEGTMEWAAGGMFLSFSGQFQNAAALNLTGTGTLLSTNTPGPFVLVNEAGGTVRKTGAGTFTLDGVRLRNQAGATVALDAGTLALTAAFEQEPGATLVGAGRLAVPTSVLAGTVRPGPADAPGELTWDGPFAPGPAARLVAEVGAGGAGDALRVTGPVALGGALVVSVRPGYTPQVGDAFTVLTGPQPTGLFASVVTAGAPAGVAFAAQVVQGGVRVTAQAAAGGAVQVFPDSLVAGDRRTVVLLGPLAEATAARLVCTSCLDAAAFGTIPAEALTPTPDGLAARFDVSDPRVVGHYDVVVDLPGGAQSRAPLPVRPFVSVILFDPEGPFGLPVVPAPDYRWSTLRATTVSNSAEPAYPLVRVAMPAQPYVRVQLNSAFHGYGTPLYDRPTAADAAEALVLLRVAPGVGAPLNVGSGIAPERVRFPGEPLPADTTTQVAFGAPVRFGLGGTSNLPLGAAARALADALRTSASAALTAYVAQVDAASSGAVAAAARGTVDASGTLALNPAEVLAEVLARTSAVVPAPGGLAETAAGAFQAAFRAQAEARDRAAAQAISAALAAGGPTGALVQRELDRVRSTAPRAGTRAAALTAAARRGGPAPDASARAGGFFSFFFGCRNPVVDNDERVGDLLDQMQTGQANGAAPVQRCVTGPFDPNDKTTQSDLACEIGTVVVDGEPVRRCVRYAIPLARRGDEIAYTVEFENDPIATAPAERVAVTDVLDSDLDPATLRILGTSSDSTFTYTVSGQTVTFYFTGIDLPPNVNAPEGQGHVSFAVRPRPNLPDGAQILNSAAIVFDFNPPILTPTVEHVVRRVADPVVALGLPAEIVTDVPFTATLAVRNDGPDAATDAALALALPPGWAVVSAATDAGSCDTPPGLACTLGELALDGVATVTAVLRPGPPGPATLTATATTSGVDARFFDSEARADVTVLPTVGGEEGAAPTALTLAPTSPNPFRARARVRFGLPAAGPAEVAAFDGLGRRVATLVDGPMAAGWHEVTWASDGLAAGVYVLRLAVGSEARTVRVLHVR